MAKKRKIFSEHEFSVEIKDRLPQELTRIQKELERRVVGQQRAIGKAVRSLTIFYSGLKDPQRPPPPLIFAGPSGVGKTLLAEVLAEVWLGEAKDDERGPLVKISGENYSQEHEGASLKGSPPGYIGHGGHSFIEDVGMFDQQHRTERLRHAIDAKLDEFYEKLQYIADQYVLFIAEHMDTQAERIFAERTRNLKPYRSVFLVDEFEKMHATVQKQFLGILDKGMLQLHSGRVVDFRGCLIIFTTNIGTEDIAKILEGRTTGFVRPAVPDPKKLDQQIYERARDRLRRDIDPALYSRIGHDRIVVFHSLSQADYEKILTLEIARVQEQFDGSQDALGAVLLQTTKAFHDFLLGQADKPWEGARQVLSLIDKYMREPLSRAVASEELWNGDAVLFAVENGDVKLSRIARPEKMEKSPIRPKDADVASAAGVQEELAKIFDEILVDLGIQRRKSLSTPPDTGDSPSPGSPPSPNDPYDVKNSFD